MSTPSHPSSSAAELHGPRSEGHSLARRLTLRHLIGLACSCALVLAVGAVSTTILATIGTRDCEVVDDDLVCVESSWWPMTIQRRAEVRTSHGVADGSRREWHSNGVLSWTGAYERGQRSGPWREYWPTGSLRFAGTYVGDALEGAEVWFFPEGGIEWIVERRAGRRTGVERWFWPNGRLRREGRFVDGEKEGVFRSWSEEGQLLSTTTYARGLRSSPE